MFYRYIHPALQHFSIPLDFERNVLYRLYRGVDFRFSTAGLCLKMSQIFSEASPSTPPFFSFLVKILNWWMSSVVISFISFLLVCEKSQLMNLISCRTILKIIFQQFNIKRERKFFQRLFMFYSILWCYVLSPFGRLQPAVHFSFSSHNAKTYARAGN